MYSRRRRLLLLVVWMSFIGGLICVAYLNYDDQRIPLGQTSTHREAQSPALSTAFPMKLETKNNTESPPNTDYLSSFQEMYTSKVALRSTVKDVWATLQKPWSRNQRELARFRQDLVLALKNVSGKHHFYLTKENTAVGSTLPFYLAGKKQTVSASLWNSLPEKSIFGTGKRQFQTCSVVGSSGILLGSHCGKEIDKAEFVLRFNLATVRGFEDDVGHKTNFTTLNPTYIRKRFNSLKSKPSIAAFKASLQQFRRGLLWLPAFGVRSYQPPLLKVAGILATGDVMTPIYGDPIHFSAVRSIWSPILAKKQFPSTGLYMLTAAFEFCENINLFGAWPFDKSTMDEDVSYHYHDNISASHHHSFKAEFMQMLHLHNLGIVKLHYSKCL